ncbi:MAG: protein kinase, partial [Ktedonobacteraceae bacterium]|nr:protein kinase [Ktedonobacteraceae bacterium]
MQVEVLGERYQLQDPIGRGGMATIYRGRDLRMDRTVAIKVLREVYSTDPKFVTRFQREAKAASSLQHPNIVQVFDYGQTDGNYFIVMEMIDGTDLRRYLRSRGILAIDRAMLIARDVALGLGAAHRRGIVHRDVKPQNVLVGRDGSIKLTDFGIASVYKDINDERLTTTGMTLGTVQYYAPEQAQGEIVSPAADVYALGIVMYEMLTGRTPFDGDTPVAVAMQHIQDPPTPPSHLNPDIPPALEEIILRCLEKVPEMRFRDGSTLAHALETLGAEEPGGSNPPPGYTPPISGPHNRIPQRPVARPAGGAAGVPDLVTANGGAFGQGSEINNAAAQTVSSLPTEYNAAMAEADPRAQPYPMSPSEFSPQSYGGGTATRDQRESRFASIVTVLILIATLLLLGFSIYLANDLGFLPFGRNGGLTPTATVQQVQVPNLVGSTYQDAKKKAEALGFKLRVTNGLTDGVVASQDPSSTSMAAAGSEIRVELKATVKMPANLTGKTVGEVKQILHDAGITNVIVAVDTNDPSDPAYGLNIVTRVDPPSGSNVEDGQQVTLFVTNLTNGTPTPTAPPATAAPTPT